MLDSDVSNWSVVHSSLFEDSFEHMRTTFRDLGEKLDKFLKLKMSDPINEKYGKHDRRMHGDLSGFHHCHLRDDAILIYRLDNRNITLVCVTPHSNLEGKRLKLTAKRLSSVM